MCFFLFFMRFHELELELVTEETCVRIVDDVNVFYEYDWDLDLRKSHQIRSIDISMRKQLLPI